MGAGLSYLYQVVNYGHQKMSAPINKLFGSSLDCFALVCKYSSNDVKLMQVCKLWHTLYFDRNVLERFSHDLPPWHRLEMVKSLKVWNDSFVSHLYQRRHQLIMIEYTMSYYLIKLDELVGYDFDTFMNLLSTCVRIGSSLQLFPKIESMLCDEINQLFEGTSNIRPNDKTLTTNESFYINRNIARIDSCNSEKIVDKTHPNWHKHIIRKLVEWLVDNDPARVYEYWFRFYTKFAQHTVPVEEKMWKVIASEPKLMTIEEIRKANEAGTKFIQTLDESLSKMRLH